MKNLLFALVLVTQVAPAQSYIINVVQDTAQKKRFEKYEIRQHETLSDTLLVDRYPASWLDSAGFQSYTVSLIDALMERQNEIRRLLKLNKDEADLYVSFYEQAAGAGAYLALQKSRIIAALQGAWTLKEVTDNQSHDVTITNAELRKNASRFGNLIVNDNLEVVLSGFYAFDLTFKIASNGTLRADRNGKAYVLKRR